MHILNHMHLKFLLCFRWYFAIISVSGVFAVTFSVIFAYVADITQEHERTMAYGMVCITHQHIIFISLLAALFCINVSVLLPKGLGHVCGESGDQPGHRRVSESGVWRQSGSSSSFSHRYAGHLLYTGGRARIAAGKDETGILGRPNLMGTSRPLRCK